MAVEIELKAWVDDREAVEKRIEALAVFTSDFEKDDVYWTPVPEAGKPQTAVRIRRECIMARDKPPERLTLVTYKKKETRCGIEVNDEKEFAVTGVPPKDAAADGEALAAFRELLDRLGLAPGMSKKKRGRSWKYSGGAVDGITVELSAVERLGCFLELEILASDDSPATVNAARGRLLDFLKLAGVSENRIESRYYNEMLQIK